MSNCERVASESVSFRSGLTDTAVLVVVVDSQCWLLLLPVDCSPEQKASVILRITDVCDTDLYRIDLPMLTLATRLSVTVKPSICVA